MRLTAFVAMLLGVLLAFAYPAWVDLRPSGEISRYSLSPTPGIVAGPTLDLASGDAPLAILLEAEVIGATDMPTTLVPNADFSLNLLRDGRPQQTETLRIEFADLSGTKPISQARARQNKPFLVLDPVPAGRFAFEVRRIDEGALPLGRVTLTIHRNYAAPDDRVAPAGFLLLAIGGIGFVLARRRKPQKIDPRPPRENKWGR